jgi:hypothetical protein
MAKAAPGHCRGCGFLQPLGGLLGQAFGLCANEFGADGRVVALGYGCGAHSSVREIEGTGVPVTEIVIDENVLDALDLRSVDELAVEVPAVVAELMADGSEVVVVAEPDVPSLSDDVEAWTLDTDLAAPDAELEVVGLQAVAEDDDEDDDGYLVDDEDDDSDDEAEDEADDDGYLVDDDEDDDDDDDEDEDDEVSPDQIALVLDDVDDIEPDEIL